MPPPIPPPSIPAPHPYHHYHHRPHWRKKYDVFYLLTGITFCAFASGFVVCLFNLSTVDACVSYAQMWFDILKKMGDHIVEWFFLVLNKLLGNPTIR